MSAAKWTLRYGGETKTLAEWGLSNLTLSRMNQAADIVGFDHQGVAIDAEPLFAYDSEVRIYRDDVQWFVGLVKLTPKAGSGPEEQMRYLVHGPWVWLEETIFRQQWQTMAGAVYTSHCLLNNGATLAAQIGQVLDWVIYRGAPLQKGDILLPQAVPGSDVRDMACSEVIRQQMRWCRDAVSWFDYATEVPTLHIRRSTDMEALDLPIEGMFSPVELVPRYDIQLPSVVLNWETTSTVDGAQKISVETHIAPAGATGLERRALVGTFDLTGATVTTISNEVTTVPNNCAAGSDQSADRLAWWRDKIPALANTSRYRNLKIQSVAQTVKPVGAESSPIAVNLPRELVDSSWPDWMEEETGYVARWVQVTATALFDLYFDDGTLHQPARSETVSARVLLTDAVDGVYETVSAVESGESASDFSGLAEWLYSVNSVLHYDGKLTASEQDVYLGQLMGKKINLTGGTGRFAGIGAIIQQVNQNVDTGTTEITLGAPNHLGPSDIIELVRAFRSRKRWIRAEAQTDGTSGEGGKLTDTGRVSNHQAGIASEMMGRTILRSGANAIDLDPSQCGGKTLVPRQMNFCVDGVQRKWVVLASEIFD